MVKATTSQFVQEKFDIIRVPYVKSVEQIDKILELNSDAQAYKQAGNGVTVNVIEAIGRRLFQVHSGIHVLQ